jgi:hypothetical protein
VPVIDLTGWLGLPEAPPPTRLMIVRVPASESVVGIPYSGETRSLDLPVLHQVSPRPLPISRERIIEAVEILSETIVLPNLSLFRDPANQPRG